jgi:xanthine dehydrogenase molybdenum-binding subunit
MEKQSFHAVGKQTIRKDGIAKVTGQEIYTSDVTLPRMLYGRVLRCPYPHARITKIDVTAAERVGAICLTFKDIPKIKYNERLVSIPRSTYKDRFVLADKARHVGEAVAAVAAESEELAEKALALIQVEYEPQPAIFDPLEALKPGAPVLHESIIVGDEERKIEYNIAASREIREGNPEQGFSEADLVLEEEFQTGRVYHAQMETKAVVCRPEADGGITFSSYP